jgi:hypothetical protein
LLGDAAARRYARSEPAALPNGRDRIIYGDP